MRKTLSVRSMAQIAISAALTAVLSQISFPMPSGVPVTLQTLAVALCGFVLGAGLGTGAVGLYLLLGGSPADADACKELLIGYQVVSADLDLDAELTDGFKSELLTALGAEFGTDNAEAIVSRASLAELFAMLAQ